MASANPLAADTRSVDMITVAVPEDSPPLVFSDSDGQLQGLRVDMWALWQEATGIRVKLVPLPFKDAKTELLRGRVDAIDFVSSAEAENDQIELSAGYMPTNLSLYYHKSVSGIVDAKSTRGFVVGVRYGGACTHELLAGGSGNLRTFSSFESLAAAAVAGDIRVLCLPDQQAGYLLNRAGRAGDFRHSPPLRTFSAHWGVRQGNTAMKTLIADGYAHIPSDRRQATFDRWLGAPVTEVPAYLRHLAKGLAATGLAFGLLLVWLWTMRRSVKHRTADLLAATTALDARVREQTCLNAVFKASEDLHLPISDMLKAVAQALFMGPKCPTVAGISVEWEGHHHAVGEPGDDAIRVTSPLRGEGQARGWLTVAYRHDGDGATMPEGTQTVVDLVAQRLATVFERRVLQDQRRELDRQMFQMEKLTTVGELTMGLAHEIGNPLGGMKAVAQSLQYDEMLSADSREDLGRLEAEIDRLSSFLRSFHGYAAQQPPRPEPCVLSETLDDVLFWTRRDAQSRKVGFKVDITGELPPLRADRHQLKQVLLNLVMNAIQAQPDGGTVLIRARPRDPLIELEVADSGPGIAPEMLARIFEPFFTTRREGSGLGLPIVRKIVEDHGGSISIHSNPGAGTRVVLNWPIAQQDHDPIDPAR